MQKLLAAACLFFFSFTNITAQAVSFSLGTLSGESLTNPTSLQFGPDGRLYVSQQNGLILIYTIVRNGPNDYQVTATETITLVQQIPNHNDDGTLAESTNVRQVTGIFVAGTAAEPVIYVTSSDPRIGGGGGATNKNLDTNSGIISRLTKTNGTWDKLDLVRGLPRSEENHSPNGLEYDPADNYLYMAQGGNTNMGAPSNNFVNTPEYAYSTAILRIDLDAIGNTTYDLPTLDDQTRTNVGGKPAGYVDPNDPFGGNDGKNQGMLVANGPVQVYSTGWRNNYDVIITEAGKMYSFDNGPNAGWGGPPSNCSNAISEPGDAECDVLHYVTQGYYAGHANPTRANRNNKFNTSNPQTPIPLGMENPIECAYSTPADRPGALTSICSSSNGMCEYTASNFGNAMKGDLLVASFNGKIYRIELSASGTALGGGGKTVLASNFGATPLDITAQGDNEIFPGSLWICTYGSGNIAVLEPGDFVNCTGDMNSFILDFDADGFSNGDETANGTDPCASASLPADFDDDHISDLTDPDDDNDGINDDIDRFALDALNGFSTTVPVRYDFDNSEDGGILNWGFTGLMTSGGTDYSQLFDADAMTVGGAALKFTIEQVPAGDALDNLNNQLYGFQFGVNSGASQWSYIIHSRVMGPFAGFSPANNQSMGMFLGTGDEDNYLKIVTAANGGAGGIQVLKEEGGSSTAAMHNASILNKSYIDLFFYVNKNTHAVQPRYSIEGGPEIAVGSPVTVPANWLSGVLAVGFISTSRGSGQVFPATWDFIEVTHDPAAVVGQWYQLASYNSPVARHECSYVQAGNKFYLLGGRGGKPVQCYDPHDSLWTNEASNPLEIHHFQAVEYNGLIYAVCAFTGSYPHEAPIPNIYVYDPVAKQWSIGPPIPANRRRGSAGVVVYDDKIYVVGGIQDGHSSGWVKWTDVFNPQNNTWTQLADAPIERDHFNAAVVNGKIYCIGGRRTNWDGNVFNPTVAQVDVYNITGNTWETLPSNLNIPTPRAACATAILGDEILAIGGESGSLTTAHNETEAFNYVNQSWRTLAPLIQGRHATGAIVSNGGVYIVCGSGNRGGSPELGTQEVFYFFDPMPPTGNEIEKGNLAPDAIGKYFGLVQPGNSFVKSLTLENTGGNQVIMLNALALSDSANFSVEFPHTLPFLLGVNQTVTVDVTFQPGTPGIKNASLQIQHNGNNNPLLIALQGEGSNQTCVSNCVNSIYFPDADGDQYGYPADSVVSALAPTGYVLNNLDCDDSDSGVNPEASELSDSIDNNCNGLIDEGLGPPKLLYIVGNTILTVSDAAIKSRMDQLGFDVTTVSDAAVQTGDAEGQDMIFLSATVTSGNIGEKFTNVAVPLVNCEPALIDDLKLTSGEISDFGSITNQTQLNIINPSHPLAGGLSSGTQTVLNSTDRLVYGVPSSSAAAVATVPGNNLQMVIFGYEAGSAMAGISAPARRVGFFLYESGAGKMNANGFALLDAALLWATNSNVPPQVSISFPANGTAFTAPASFSISASAFSSTGSITNVEFYQNNSLLGSDNASPYTFNIANLGAGSYSFHAKAYDNHGLASVSASVNVNAQSSGGSGQALLIVGNTALNSGDQALKTRMETLGFTVVVKDAAASASSDANGKDLVFISSTINSSDASTKFKNVAVPVIVCENALLDDMDMASDPSGNYGTVSGTNGIVVTNSSHPLAAGLSTGNAVVYASNNSLTWGKPGPNATAIANVAGNATQIVLFAYETGVEMAGINAPARRVGFFLTDVSASLLTAQGTQLLDAALLWTAPFAIPDCNGDMNGSAFVNDCGICVGGNTGLPADEAKDCAGDCNGTAYVNGCGICVEGNTGLPANAGLDCTGQCGSAFVNDCGICVGGNTGLPANEGKDCHGDCGGTALPDDCGICSGGNSGHIANADKDTCSVCFGNGSSCAPPPPCVSNEVVSFTLMHEGTAGEIGPLMNGTIINLAAIGSFSIRANACNGQNVGSVKFIVNGATVKTETFAPYAINGDEPAGSYKAWSVNVGSYTLTGTPYTAAGGNGTAGVSETVSFTVINQASTTPDCNGVPGGTATVNSCGICVGGNTGLAANAGKDCNGDCNGTASLDDCGVCSGGNSGHIANADKDTCGVCFGNGSSCAPPPPCVSNEVVSFALMHEGTAGEIGPLTNGTVINLATIGSFSIRANTCNGQNVGSVKFIMNGSTVKTETFAPYAINGDEPAGSFKAWSVNVGSYTLTGTPYTAAGGNGTAGVSETVSFTVINQASTTPDCNGVPGGTATVNSCGICVGGNTGLAANAGKDCNGDCNGTAFLDDCGVCSGGNTGHIANSNKDACGVCFGNGASCAPCQPLQVTSFTIVQEGTAGDIGPLTSGMTLYLASLPDFSIRADICPGSTSVKSVKFNLNGSTVKTESAAPYAINGDTPAGSYNAWDASPGSYTLMATPYSGAAGYGTTGVSLTVAFTVASGAAPKTDLKDVSSDIQEKSFSVYPNPNTGQFMIELETVEQIDIHVRIFNHLGQVVYADVKRGFTGELKEQIQLDKQPAGMYFLQVSYGGNIFNEKIIVTGVSSKFR